MSSNVLELKVGARVWFDGGAWTVCEVLGVEVRLRDSGERYRLTAIDELLGRARDLDADADEDASCIGDWRRHEPVPHRGAPGLVGRDHPRTQRVRREGHVRHDQTRQPLPTRWWTPTAGT